MNWCVYWWFVWNRLKGFSNRWSPDSSQSSKLGFCGRSLGLATRFVRFVQVLAWDLVMSVNSPHWLATRFVQFVQGLVQMLAVDLVDVRWPICCYWCFLSTLMSLQKHNLICYHTLSEHVLVWCVYDKFILCGSTWDCILLTHSLHY